MAMYRNWLCLVSSLVFSCKLLLSLSCLCSICKSSATFKLQPLFVFVLCFEYNWTCLENDTSCVYRIPSFSLIITKHQLPCYELLQEFSLGPLNDFTPLFACSLLALIECAWCVENPFHKS